MGDLFGLVIVPLLIFLSRTLDVSLGTIRMIFISKGYKSVAPFIGFFEVLIWLVAMQQVLGNLTNVWYYLFYAGGFSFGTFVGMKIDEKLSLGSVLVRVILQEPSTLSKKLTNAGYSYTRYDAEGGSKHRHVDTFVIVIARKKLPDLLSLISNCSPNAFYVVEELRMVHSSFVHEKRGIGMIRKGK